MIKIIEAFTFNQVITAVIDDGRILDLRKGKVSEHAKNCARYHAGKADQGTIPVNRWDGKVTHLATNV